MSVAIDFRKNTMKNFLTLTALLLLSPICNTFAATEKEPLLTPPQQCSTLTCVRNNIDEIDRNIVELIGQRLQYVKRAGELKKPTQAVHDSSREEMILSHVTKQAEQLGYPGSIAANIFKEILIQANIYEKQFHH